jgi:hypothetical protein
LVKEERMRICNICGCLLGGNPDILQTYKIVYDQCNKPYVVCDDCYRDVKKREVKKNGTDD